MDPESIRNGLKDVFGSFDEFCQQISNAGGPLSTRHGVVAPATPVVAKPNPFIASASQTSPSSQSAQLCLQKMTELVEPTPLQPPLPASFSRELYQDPSSSTRSAPDEFDIKRNKRKPRNPDSDSEIERDNRKRHTEHNLKPGTSKAVHDEDAMKALFGDDAAKPRSVEKAVSPDSGVHSNEGIDDTDISSVINLMSSVLPMLSPVTERPADRERARREKAERRAKNEAEKRRKEEEKERKRLDEKRRLEDEREAERKAIEDKEKRDAEDKLKKETEERLRIQEERFRKEIEDKRKREDKRRDEEKRKEDEERKRAERQKKEEDKQRKRRKQEERLRKGEEAKKSVSDSNKELHETELQKGEMKIESLEIPQQSVDPSNRLTGLLSLQSLSNEKMSQLFDMTKKIQKNENKSSRASSPFILKDQDVGKKTIVEKDRKFNVESDSARKSRENRLDVKLETRNLPSPASSSLRKDFHCASNECIPTMRILPTKSKKENQGDGYQELAKNKKRQADQLDDSVKQILEYLECMVYFSLSAQYYAINERTGSRQISILRDTSKLIETVTNRFLHHEPLSSLGHHFRGRIRVLSIRAQAILAYHVFNYKMPSALKTYKLIEKFDDKCLIHNGNESVPAPLSPGESLNSGSSSTANNMVTMPLEVYNCYKNQLKQLHGLMNAHKLWADSVTYISKSPIDTLFVNSLESLCGNITIISQIDKMATFVLTGVSWLRQEYDRELERLHLKSPTQKQP